MNPEPSSEDIRKSETEACMIVNKFSDKDYCEIYSKKAN